MERSPQIVTGGIIIKREGRVVITATTPRQVRLARFMIELQHGAH